MLASVYICKSSRKPVTTQRPTATAPKILVKVMAFAAELSQQIRRRNKRKPSDEWKSMNKRATVLVSPSYVEAIVAAGRNYKEVAKKYVTKKDKKPFSPRVNSASAKLTNKV